MTMQDDKNRDKSILMALKDTIEKEIIGGNKPIHALKIYKDKLEKYKKDYKDLHEQEIEDITQEFGGEIIN